MGRYGQRRRPPIDGWIFALFVLAALLLFARAWLHDHPEHDPWAPLDIADPAGWATSRKLSALRDEPGACRAFLERSDIGFESLDPAGEGTCRRADRVVLENDRASGLVFQPGAPPATCAVHAALAWWMRHEVQPAAETILGSRVVAMEHLGTANCRRIGGGDSGNWSEHATGNAIDIAGFVLADGRRIRVLADWKGTDEDAASFLRTARDGACLVFSTVLSPEYNAAHADHFHLDQAGRMAGWSACR
ncbi:extensin-like domain-containing protein [Novosphingobium aquimarinum]|uniref:extensin-like domain-containing protein n=1 Tax=Novosphingobium aquimarinum TaxID=2682494 RepID=UPI0012EC7B39|nr:extensin family protein [Novosphingobium aquimarinum]